MSYQTDQELVNIIADARQAIKALAEHATTNELREYIRQIDAAELEGRRRRRLRQARSSQKLHTDPLRHSLSINRIRGIPSWLADDAKTGAITAFMLKH